MSEILPDSQVDSAEELIAQSEKMREEALNLVSEGHLGAGEARLVEAAQLFHRGQALRPLFEIEQLPTDRAA